MREQQISATDKDHPIQIALVGIGEIAKNQHAPAIAASPDFELVGTVSRNNSLPGIQSYDSLEELLVKEPGISCISLCVPPQVRFDLAKEALSAGKHIMLEKPPGATLSEVYILRELAARKCKTLFASWHSKCAPMVPRARHWIAQRTVTGVDIVWKEDVRRWHPGQSWIWQAGGLGVFDPGINAMSIISEILPEQFRLTDATLGIPENVQTAICASLKFETENRVPITAEFDWRNQGKDVWDITVKTTEGELRLTHGGSQLWVDGEFQGLEPEREYPNLYTRFAALVRSETSDIDTSPLRHVADAHLYGRREALPPFIE